MDRSLIKAFWNCGDTQIIDFAIVRARLNRHEKAALELMFDDCLTQEQAAEQMDISTRRLQQIYYDATDKLLRIPWLVAYAKTLQ